jgi:hypothetical protein
MEQSVKNSAYIHSLSLLLFEGAGAGAGAGAAPPGGSYCSSFVPKLVQKS